ncbi:hypothetical protein [Kocuria sp.]|uniref:hypothetical protein n=1 Tax=Kocuria sp. TaxID=1871328 RepID=UPI0026E0C252|nr:hypothetical protein [Kocuria sp.]MDO5619741.1 hypothetical protein [Kocuria sp.]
MPDLSVPPPPPGIRAFDSVLVEYRTVHRQPRVIFDELARQAYDAAATITNLLLVAGVSSDALQGETRPVECTLNPTVPGSYVLRYELPEIPDPNAAKRKLPRLLPNALKSRIPGPQIDEVLQEALISGNRVTVEMLLCIGVLTSIDEGRLSATAGISGNDPFVEMVDGVRVIQRVHRSTWVLLQREDIQVCLRGMLAPFQDEQLYTMTLVENPHFSNLEAAYVITASQKLRDFAHGEPLHVPPLDRS